jgi:1,2-diacylglycerol 3-alpha-glucosyltransferase
MAALKKFTLAIQYPSFGPQHPPRLEAIAKAAPMPGARVVAMEMFKKDSDYEWAPVRASSPRFERYTVMDSESAAGRKQPLKLKKAVDHALDEISPDVLVVNGWGHRESMFSTHWCWKRKVKMVLLNDSTYEDLPRRPLKEQIKKWLVRDCASAFVAGTPQARYAEYLGIPKDKIFYPGSCAVDNDYWKTESAKVRQNAELCRKKYGLPQKYFLSVSRFIEKKNIPFLVGSYLRYRELAGSVYFGLVLCGDGPDQPVIRDLISRSGLQGMVMAGFQQVDSLPVYYGLADCFIMPSRYFEQWGLVVNEAMASGLPVLVSEKCGCAEDLVREGVNGHVFDPEDPEQLANLMLDMSKDESQLRAMGKESEKVIAGHSCEVGAQNLWKAVRAAAPWD